MDEYALNKKSLYEFVRKIELEKENLICLMKILSCTSNVGKTTIFSEKLQYRLSKTLRGNN